MKRINVKVAACLMMGSLLYSSCIGSFSLFNGFCKWERNMTDNKIINGILGFFLLPTAGSVCLFVDAVVLNTIEFWTGDNPMHACVGKTQQVLGKDGRYYAVTTLKDGYEVKAPTGELSYFKYNKQQNIWSLEQNGKTTELFRFNPDDTITTLADKDMQLTVKPDEAGLYQVRTALGGGYFFALNN